MWGALEAKKILLWQKMYNIKFVIFSVQIISINLIHSIIGLPYCIGTWNVRSMNQGKLKVVKHEMATVNINILGISELKWTRMGEFNSVIPTQVVILLEWITSSYLLLIIF